MRTKLFLGPIFLAATILLANDFQPLKVQAGLWQVTATSNLTGSQHTTSYKKCVTAKDLNTNPWANGPDQKCNWTVVNSTASDMEVRGTGCEAGNDFGMDTNVDLKVHAVDSENVKASMQGTSKGNGQNVSFSGTYTGKWIGASCPAGTE
jgi:hypothetical protein